MSGNGPVPGDDRRLALLLSEFAKAVGEGNGLWPQVDGRHLRGVALREAERRLLHLARREERIVRMAERSVASSAPGLVAKASLLRLRADPWGDAGLEEIDPVERLGWSLAGDVLGFFGGRPL